ncbi:hypothetical protein TUMSATVNIG1_61260 (plasmid) [Vibrio nigripulchritudo]|uniref:hypothetical protein n=1 Tax=Vibrio nigripulchritudo TaxID=28173 RepID=UPI00190CF45D|nr:hypothetical protein [Vibrio nigripulchritudo]BCL74142.1 hypothetical protein VNTUMSATTG_60790 [Vibrio nigripulchritudo]BDU35517.1 hypothetical protein TUMSATVNIG1_61260 [Vibrio nigripulchritudo]
MKKKTVALILLMAPFFANATMTEEQCKPQAMTVSEVSDMIDSGILPAEPDVKEALAKAKEHVEKGEYCKARKILLNLG